MKKLLLSLLIATSVGVSAAPLEKDDRKAIDDILTPWLKTIKDNPSESLALMPPKFFGIIAKQVGMPEEDLKKMTLDTLNSAMAEIEMVSYHLDVDKAEAAKSSSGRDYAFIPQVTKLKPKAGGEEMVVEGYMLGIEDEGKWYFINWEPQYAPIIAELYPDLKDLKAPQ